MGRRRKGDDPMGLAGTRLAFRRGKFWYRHRLDGRWECVGTDLAQAKKVATLYNDPSSNFGTVAYWMGLFLADYRARRLRGKISQRTLDDYTQAGGDTSPLMIYFGAMLPEHIQPNHVQAYIDGGADDRAVRVNRERACLSSMLSWVLRQPDCPPEFKLNPCFRVSGVQRNEETARERYVTHEEYQEVWAVATKSERVLMAITYRTLQRPESDIVKWTMANVLTTDSGRVLSFRQNKTHRLHRIALGPELEALIPAPLPGNVRSITEPLVHRLDGDPYTYGGIAGMLKESIRAANVRRKARGKPPIPSFGFRDLKGKGATDMWLSGVPIETIQQLCGHANKSTTEKYVKARWLATAQPNAVPLVV